MPQLHDVLCGGHVLIDDPQLYEDWRFTGVSHLRISSHHRDIDKARYPDIGMRGQVVREKLHGRTAQGTWVQLEKTPAAFGKRKLPSLNDIRYLLDYVIYRVTRSNVGPWGLSQLTERRPMYLSPDLAVPVSLPPSVAESLALALRRISAADDTTAVSHDLARRFPPPGQADPANELGRALPGRAGRGLFGNSKVWVTETPRRSAAAILGEQVQVRGDLGIAVAFEQRARMVMDARATAAGPGEPWRILLLAQPEGICLMYRIDTFGVHQIGLYKLDESLRQLTAWLPQGSQADPDSAVDPEVVLASAEHAALITLTRYSTQGSAEIAGASTDLILARDHGRLHLFSRDPHNPAKLVPAPWKGSNVRDTLAGLLT